MRTILKYNETTLRAVPNGSDMNVKHRFILRPQK